MSVLYVIAGPTASGKSKLALDLAREIDGEIINADAIQVYQEIPILAAIPSNADKALVQHHLYNYVSITDSYSVGRYITDAVAVIHEITVRGKVPILVGGTGMYIKSLCYGIHNVPNIDPAIRTNSRHKFQELGNTKFYEALWDLDPEGAAKLRVSDSQRLIRFYEVFMQTGRSILEFYNEKPSLFLENYNIHINILETDRKMLYERCDARFVEMIENGALNEVSNVRSLYADTTAAEKAIGFNELSRYLDGLISREDAILSAQARTRQYAKRQMTWFRHQLHDAVKIEFIPILNL